MNFKAFLNLNNGTKQVSHVNITEKRFEDINAVYIDGISDKKLNPEFGAAIEIKTENIKSWMADYRHSEFWCRPKFGNDICEIPDETQGLICEKNEGNYLVILPVVSEQYKCVLCGSESADDGKTIIAKLFSWHYLRMLFFDAYNML